MLRAIWYLLQELAFPDDRYSQFCLSERSDVAVKTLHEGQYAPRKEEKDAGFEFNRY